VIIIYFLIIILPAAHGAAGNVCNSSSPCVCGTACNSSYEIDNGYNTIDSCQDGYDGFERYEWVQNMSIISLGGSTFQPGGTVEAKGMFWCGADPEGASFWYYNGSGWRNVSFWDCYIDPSGYLYFAKNFTLDSVAGNHTLRAIAAYILQPTHSCGFDTGLDYSDTDDITFEVADVSKPSVIDVKPIGGSTYELIEGLTITISANVTDDIGLDFVKANISWDSRYETVNLTDSDGDSKFEGTFSNVSTLTRYNVTIIARDTAGNLNDTETTYFNITYTSNITIDSPINDSTYTNESIPLRFRILDESVTEWVGYQLNGNANITVRFSLNITVNQSDSDGVMYEEDKNYNNLSQSFVPKEDMNVNAVQIKLRRNGSGTANATLQIRTDNNGSPSDTVLGYGNITSSNVSNTSFSFVSITLNNTVNLSNNTRYWLFLTPNGSATDYYSWEANDDGAYELGNYSNNNSRDLLFRIYDKYKYRTSLNAVEGSNNVIIYTNNTLGVMRNSVLIFFTLDTSGPLQSFILASNDTIELGHPITIRINIYDPISGVDTALIEINHTDNYTMTVEEGDTHNFTFTPNSTGTWFYKFYTNDSVNNMNISLVYNFSVVDTTGPSFLSINYSPNSTLDMDPNTTIVVSANVTDISGVVNVTLQYKESNASQWTNISMVNVSSIYSANFTPNSLNNWTFRIASKDVFNNTNLSDSINLSVVYDWNWTRLPETFDAVGGTIGSNITIGNLTINNTGDYSLEFNLSLWSGTPSVYFNESLLNVSNMSFRLVEVTATAPITVSEYPLVIKTDAINTSAYPDFLYSNTTLVAYISGPYLYLEIVNYDSSVTQRDHIDNLTVKVTNLGNETATNVWINWTLPSGWSSRDNLTQNIGNLSVGASDYFDISADVGPEATTGTVEIVTKTNCSEGKYNSLSRSVTVSSYSVQETSSGGGGTSGGGGGVVVRGGGGFVLYTPPEYNLSITAPEIVEIVRGDNDSFSVEVKNTVKGTFILNISLVVEGFYRSNLIIEPGIRDKLEYSQIKKYNITVRVPYYIGEGKYPLNIVVSADASDKNITVNNTDSKRVTFSKQIMLIVLKTEKDAFTRCLIEAESKMREMEEAGFNVFYINDKIRKAKQEFSNNNYRQFRELCEKAKELEKKAYEIEEAMDEFKAKLQTLRYSRKGSEKIFGLVKDAFNKGDFELAEKLMKDALAIYAIEAQVRESLADKLKRNWRIILYSSLIIFIVAIETYKRTSLRMLNKKLRELKEVDRSVLEQVKRTQDNYFNKKMMSVRVYKRYMNQHRKSVANIQEKISNIELRKIRLSRSKQPEHFEREKERIINLIKRLQEKYFTEKIIDKKIYDKLFMQYRSIITDIDKRIAMLNKGKEGTKR
jgi:tetratricopeptide (TPR) repeat protein